MSTWNIIACYIYKLISDKATQIEILVLTSWYVNTDIKKSYFALWTETKKFCSFNKVSTLGILITQLAPSLESVWIWNLTW